MDAVITMPEIARLANVTRQAVTNWRSRPASTPFPDPVSVVDNVEMFSAEAVLGWLEATGRGRNSEARLDAPALSAPEDLPLEQAVVLLALRAKVSEDLGSLTPEQRVELAAAIDPEDMFLLSEMRSVAADDSGAEYVDDLMEASYGPADALARLYDTRPARGTDVVAPVLIDALQAIASACRSFLGPDGVAVDLNLDPCTRKAASGFSNAAAGGDADRVMLRHLALEGLTIEKAAGPRVRVLSTIGSEDAETLDQADNVALDLAAGDLAIVVGPASALCDRLTGSAYEARKKTLLMGSTGSCALVAAVKLPRGLWRRAHRHHLGLWVLQGGGTGGRALVADLSGHSIDVSELADDVLGALEQSPARAYRYGRMVPYTDVWTRDTVVVPGVGAAPPLVSGSHSPLDRVVEASLVTREEIGGLDIRVVAKPATTRLAPRSLGEFIDNGSITLLRGSRIAGEHCDRGGAIRVLSAAPRWPATGIDALLAADEYPHAVRTEPGDVVFVASPDPRALVDEDGGSRVASPSRILRVDQRRASIGPRALATAINQMATSAEWKTWPVPVIPPAQIPVLEEALGDAFEHLTALRHHQDAATAVITNLIQGVAEGSVTLDSPTIDRKAG